MKKKLIYIVGGGHSGSTLIDVIIGSSSKVVSLGEVYFFNSYNYDINDPKIYNVNSKTCSCKQEFNKCEFWNDVKKNANKELSISRKYTFIESFKILWNIYTPIKKMKFRLRIEDNLLFFNSIAKKLEKEKSKAEYLLDSSKDPRRLVLLAETIGIENLFVIHIARDVRGYVNSYSNKNKWRVKDAGLKIENPFIVAIRWVIVNIASRFFLKRNNINHINLSYDLFSKNPQNYINYINDILDIDISSSFLDIVNSKEYHNIHGNLMKFKKISEIKYDNTWNRELPKVLKTILTFFFYPFNKSFVYKDSITKK